MNGLNLKLFPEIISKNQFLHTRIWFTLLIAISLLMILSWQYVYSKIPSHYFLDNKNMPLISNAWGALTVPIATWFLFFRIERRLFSTSENIVFPIKSVLGFLSALLFSLGLGLAIQYDLKTISSNVPFIIFGLALFFPVHRAESYLGFILGLTYFVGGVLPMVIGAVFLMIAYIIHIVFRPQLIKVIKTITK